MNGPCLLDAFGADVFQGRGDHQALNGANREFNRHAHRELFHLRLVNFSDKNEVLHVGDRSDGRAFVEVVGLDDAVALFYWNVQHHALNGGGNQCVGGTTASRRNAVLNDAQVVLSCVKLLLRLFACQLKSLEICRRNDAVLQEQAISFSIGFRIFQTDAGALQPGFGTAQSPHVRYHHDFCQHLAGLDQLAGFDLHPANDARNLWFDEDLLPGLNGSSGDGFDDDVTSRWRLRAV